MSYFNSKRQLNALVIVLLVVNVFSITALWISTRDKKPGPPGRQANGEKFLQESLDLSDAQVSVIKELRESHFQELEALMRVNHESRRNLFEEIKAIKPDSVLLVKYAAQIGSIRAAIEELTTKHFLDIKAELREDQIPKFNQTVERLLPRPEGPGRPGRPPHGRPGRPGGPGGPGGPDGPGRPDRPGGHPPDHQNPPPPL